MKEKSQKTYYIGIKAPKELRRNSLEASKSVISSMQKQQRILDIQTEKNILKQKLKEDVKELKLLFSKLERQLPENLAESENSKKAEANKADAKPKIPRIKSKETEVDRLHAHLSIIEERLKNIK